MGPGEAFNPAVDTLSGQVLWQAVRSSVPVAYNRPKFPGLVRDSVNRGAAGCYHGYNLCHDGSSGRSRRTMRLNPQAPDDVDCLIDCRKDAVIKLLIRSRSRTRELIVDPSIAALLKDDAYSPEALAR